MEITYAVLLLHSTKQPVNAENLKKVLHAAGAQTDDSKLKAVAAALEGVNIEDAIKQAAVVHAAPAAGAKAEEKKEEKAEEKKEEEAAAGLASLFG